MTDNSDAARETVVPGSTLLRSSTVRISLLLALFCTFLAVTTCSMISMPGESYSGDPPPLTASQKKLRERLRDHVTVLAGDVGVRNVSHIQELNRARDYIRESFASLGFDPDEQTYTVRGETVANLQVEVPGAGRSDEIVLIGAHYDTASTPGADDNATGVAGALELARHFRDHNPQRTLRFVTFVNEEPPFFQTDRMGSRVYAKRARQRDEQIVEMISLEMLGYYSSQPNSQSYPFPVSLFYPSKGNFIAFVTCFTNRDHVHRTIRVFRENAAVPSQGGAPPSWITGVGWSDHWSFWQEGYPGIMITDTAVFRNPHYHRATDRPDTIDYDRMTRVVHGLFPVVKSLTRPGDE